MPFPERLSCRARLPSLHLPILLAFASWAAASPASAEVGTAPAASTDERVSSGDVGRRDAALRPRWIEPARRVSRPPDPEPSGRRPPPLIGDSAGDSPPLAAALESASDGWKHEARLVVHGVSENAELGVLVAKLLRDLGADDVEHRLVERTTSIDEVRYFRRADAAMAADVAAELGSVFEELRVRDFTHYRPSPSSGLLELWLR